MAWDIHCRLTGFCMAKTDDKKLEYEYTMCSRDVLTVLECVLRVLTSVGETIEQ